MVSVVGLAAEDSKEDRRVALRPDDVALLRLRPEVAQVLVEAGAGTRLGYSDSQYAAAGAVIVDPEALWTRADLIVKYKAPSARQRALARNGLTIAAIMHPEADTLTVDWLIAGRHKGYSLEYYEVDGVRPISSITGRITGEMAFHYGVHHLQSHLGGSGKLASGQRDDPARVVVIGHGNVGGAAAQAAARAGCRVFVAGRTERRAGEFVAQSGLAATPLASSGSAFDACVSAADIVIGAILISTFDTPPILERRHVASMATGSVIVDATAGYGSGYVESMPEEMSLEPVAISGVIHLKIDRYPALVPGTTVREVSREFMSAVVAILQGRADVALVVGDGRVTNAEVQRHRVHRSVGEP